MTKKPTIAINTLLTQAQQLQNTGRLQEAFALYQLIPTSHWNSEVMNAYAILLIQQGNYSQAETMLRKVLKHSPKSTVARMNLGNLALQQGDTKTAIRELEQLLSEGIDSPNLYYNLGRALAIAGRLTDSLDILHKCHSKYPNYSLLPLELGNVLRKLNRHHEARIWYQQALIHQPRHPGIWINISNSFLGEDNFVEAETAIQKALTLDSNYAEAWSNLCIIRLRQGLLDQAEQAGKRAIELNPNFAGGYRNFIQVLIQKGDLNGAYLYLQRECALANASLEAKLRLIRLLGERHNYVEAVELEQSLDTKIYTAPDWGVYLFSYRRAICSWTKHADMEQQVATYIKTAKIERGMQLSPWMALQVEGITAKELRAYTEAVSNYLFKGLIPLLPVATVDNIYNDKPIRIGYLSADFHAHATSYLMIEVFEQHNRNKFEIFAYALDADDASPMRQRLRAAFTYWRDVSAMSAFDIATMIQADKIDILVDLKGYTQKAKPEVFVFRPAPIQVAYLGYPGTMGTEALDYLIADDFIIPPTHQVYYREKIAYLPDCYQANSANRDIASTISREEEHLPETGLILCCFNHPRKISPKIFNIWCKILKHTPTANLWLLATNQLVEKNLRAEATIRGILASRLIFATRRPQAEHLSRLRLADLFLDTYPINAHTTASDALYMGVPLITCAGETFASRVAGSLLHACNLDDLITHNLQDYASLLMRLMQNPNEIANLKQRLIKNLATSPLFDSSRFTRNLEHLYQSFCLRT